VHLAAVLKSLSRKTKRFQKENIEGDGEYYVKEKPQPVSSFLKGSSGSFSTALFLFLNTKSYYYK
jgi:hypothetical protein